MLGVTKANTLSSQYLVSCDTNNYGCKGGYIDEGYCFALDKGIPTERCSPYDSILAPACPKYCIDRKPLYNYKCTENSILDLSYDTEYIMSEVRMKGAVSGSMIVYGDFIHYAEGIYRHVYGADLGRQGVTITGYGYENGTDYWLVANSWGRDWGEDGWFKIAFGEADIEGDVWTCMPQI
jgi:cathepsin B